MGADSVVYCYVIKTHFDTFYTGITNDIDRRMKEHWNRQSSYLSKVLPNQVVYVESCLSRKLARKREVYIKLIGASNFLKLVRFNRKFVHLKIYLKS